MRVDGFGCAQYTVAKAMRTFRDFEGRAIRLTAERRAHILEHPEMAGMADLIGETLRSPEHVVVSISDAQARLYYRYYFGTVVGDKYLCVVVKAAERDAFVITAYLTDAIKAGVGLWPRKP